jgi:hypothetical protein
MPAKAKKQTMSDAHKKALAEGRNQAKIVGRYLEALEANKPRRGRKRTADSVQKRLATVESDLKSASSLQRLSLLQERRNLEVELAGMQAGGTDLSGLEKEFVKVARTYGSRKGITYGAWREFGIPPDVLKKAGITRAAS